MFSTSSHEIHDELNDLINVYKHINDLYVYNYYTTWLSIFIFFNINEYIYLLNKLDH